MGCVENGTTCDSCFNWNLSTNASYKAKQLASAACTTNVANTVTDCKYYKGTIGSTKSKTDCIECNSKTWLNITDHATAGSETIACSATALSSTNCASAVSNCSQSICYKPTSGNEKTLCAKCASGYTGSGTLQAGVGYPTCSTTGIVANCDVHDTLDNTKCYQCKTGYAVASTEKACTTFTSDTNCRKISADSTPFCTQCKSMYYFDSKTCKLQSSLMMFSGLILAALMFFN